MRRSILFFATGFGVGYLPKMPGTYGSLVGLVLYHFLAYLPHPAYSITIFVLILVVAWVATEAEILLQKHDPQQVVIDEMVGMVVALYFVPCSWKAVGLAFLLFRLFDIWKPFPCRWIQEKVPAGWGIVGDDVMAGIYANLLVQLVIRIHGFL